MNCRKTRCIKCGDEFEPYRYAGIMIVLCKECRYGFSTDPKDHPRIAEQKDHC